MGHTEMGPLSRKQNKKIAIIKHTKLKPDNNISKKSAKSKHVRRKQNLGKIGVPYDNDRPPVDKPVTSADSVTDASTKLDSSGGEAVNSDSKVLSAAEELQKVLENTVNILTHYESPQRESCRITRSNKGSPIVKVNSNLEESYVEQEPNCSPQSAPRRVSVQRTPTLCLRRLTESVLSQWDTCTSSYSVTSAVAESSYTPLSVSPKRERLMVSLKPMPLSSKVKVMESMVECGPMCDIEGNNDIEKQNVDRKTDKKCKKPNDGRKPSSTARVEVIIRKFPADSNNFPTARETVPHASIPNKDLHKLNPIYKGQKRPRSDDTDDFPSKKRKLKEVDFLHEPQNRNLQLVNCSDSNDVQLQTCNGKSTDTQTKKERKLSDKVSKKEEQIKSKCSSKQACVQHKSGDFHSPLSLVGTDKPVIKEEEGSSHKSSLKHDGNNSKQCSDSQVAPCGKKREEHKSSDKKDTRSSESTTRSKHKTSSHHSSTKHHKHHTSNTKVGHNDSSSENIKKKHASKSEQTSINNIDSTLEETDKTEKKVIKVSNICEEHSRILVSCESSSEIADKSEKTASNANILTHPLIMADKSEKTANNANIFTHPLKMADKSEKTASNANILTHPLKMADKSEKTASNANILTETLKMADNSETTFSNTNILTDSSQKAVRSEKTASNANILTDSVKMTDVSEEITSYVGGSTDPLKTMDNREEIATNVCSESCSDIPDLKKKIADLYAQFGKNSVLSLLMSEVKTAPQMFVEDNEQITVTQSSQSGNISLLQKLQIPPQRDKMNDINKSDKCTTSEYVYLPSCNNISQKGSGEQCSSKFDIASSREEVPCCRKGVSGISLLSTSEEELSRVSDLEVLRIGNNCIVKDNEEEDVKCRKSGDAVMSNFTEKVPINSDIDTSELLDTSSNSIDSGNMPSAETVSKQVPNTRAERNAEQKVTYPDVSSLVLDAEMSHPVSNVAAHLDPTTIPLFNPPTNTKSAGSGISKNQYESTVVTTSPLTNKSDLSTKSPIRYESQPATRLQNNTTIKSTSGIVGITSLVPVGNPLHVVQLQQQQDYALADRIAPRKMMTRSRRPVLNLPCQRGDTENVLSALKLVESPRKCNNSLKALHNKAFSVDSEDDVDLANSSVDDTSEPANSDDMQNISLKDSASYNATPNLNVSNTVEKSPSPTNICPKRPILQRTNVTQSFSMPFPSETITSSIPSCAMLTTCLSSSPSRNKSSENSVRKPLQASSEISKLVSREEVIDELQCTSSKPAQNMSSKSTPNVSSISLKPTQNIPPKPIQNILEPPKNVHSKTTENVCLKTTQNLPSKAMQNVPSKRLQKIHLKPPQNSVSKFTSNVPTKTTIASQLGSLSETMNSSDLRPFKCQTSIAVPKQTPVAINSSNATAVSSSPSSVGKEISRQAVQSCTSTNFQISSVQQQAFKSPPSRNRMQTVQAQHRDEDDMEDAISLFADSLDLETEEFIPRRSAVRFLNNPSPFSCATSFSGRADPHGASIQEDIGDDLEASEEIEHREEWAEGQKDCEVEGEEMGPEEEQVEGEGEEEMEPEEQVEGGGEEEVEGGREQAEEQTPEIDEEVEEFASDVAAVDGIVVEIQSIESSGSFWDSHCIQYEEQMNGENRITKPKPSGKILCNVAKAVPVEPTCSVECEKGDQRLPPPLLSSTAAGRQNLGELPMDIEQLYHHLRVDLCYDLLKKGNCTKRECTFHHQIPDFKGMVMEKEDLLKIIARVKLQRWNYLLSLLVKILIESSAITATVRDTPFWDMVMQGLVHSGMPVEMAFNKILEYIFTQEDYNSISSVLVLLVEYDMLLKFNNAIRRICDIPGYVFPVSVVKNMLMEASSIENLIDVSVWLCTAEAVRKCFDQIEKNIFVQFVNKLLSAGLKEIANKTRGILSLHMTSNNNNVNEKVDLRLSLERKRRMATQKPLKGALPKRILLQRNRFRNQEVKISNEDQNSQQTYISPLSNEEHPANVQTEFKIPKLPQRKLLNQIKPGVRSTAADPRPQQSFQRTMNLKQPGTKLQQNVSVKLNTQNKAQQLPVKQTNVVNLFSNEKMNDNSDSHTPHFLRAEVLPNQVNRPDVGGSSGRHTLPPREFGLSAVVPSSSHGYNVREHIIIQDSQMCVTEPSDHYSKHASPVRNVSPKCVNQMPPTVVEPLLSTSRSLPPTPVTDGQHPHLYQFRATAKTPPSSQRVTNYESCHRMEIHSYNFPVEQNSPSQTEDSVRFPLNKLPPHPEQSNDYHKGSSAVMTGSLSRNLADQDNRFFRSSLNVTDDRLYRTFTSATEEPGYVVTRKVRPAPGPRFEEDIGHYRASAPFIRQPSRPVVEDSRDHSPLTKEQDSKQVRESGLLPLGPSHLRLRRQSHSPVNQNFSRSVQPLPAWRDNISVWETPPQSVMEIDNRTSRNTRLPLQSTIHDDDRQFRESQQTTHHQLWLQANFPPAPISSMEPSRLSPMEDDLLQLRLLLHNEDVAGAVAIFDQWWHHEEKNKFLLQAYLLFKNDIYMSGLLFSQLAQMTGRETASPSVWEMTSCIGVNLMLDLSEVGATEDAYRLYEIMSKNKIDPSLAKIFRQESLSPSRILLECCQVCMYYNLNEAVEIINGNGLLSPRTAEWRVPCVPDDITMRNQVCCELLLRLISDGTAVAAAQFLTSILEVQERTSAPIHVHRHCDRVMLNLLQDNLKQEAFNLYIALEKDITCLEQPTYRWLLIMFVTMGRKPTAQRLYKSACRMNVYPKANPMSRPLHVKIFSCWHQNEVYWILSNFLYKLTMLEESKSSTDSVPPSFSIFIEAHMQQHLQLKDYPSILLQVDDSIDAAKERILTVLKARFSLEATSASQSRTMHITPESFATFMKNPKF